MVQIFPFRGLRYNPDKVGKLDNVTAQPYDVIDRIAQKRLYETHPANVVRVILGEKNDGDNASDNVYTRAAQYLEQWQEDGILMQEDAPAVYAYSQIWQEKDGTEIERKGCIGLLKLEEFESNQVLPHEFTLKGPKIDRMNLIQATLTNLSQIFMIYDDVDCQMEQLLFDTTEAKNSNDWLVVTDENEVGHKFRPVTDTDTTQKLCAMFANQKLLIADGHHRYETALAFKNEVRKLLKEKTGQDYPDGTLITDYMMVFMANLRDPGLKVYPTHRVLYQWPQEWSRETFEAELFKRFEKVSGESDFDFQYQPVGEAPISLKLSDADSINHVSDNMKKLDCAILEEVVFKGIFKKPGAELKADHVLGFYRNEDQVARLSNDNEAVAIFRMDIPPLDLIIKVCEAGERMPQKSTYFYPKILTGLTFHQYTSDAEGNHSLSGVKDVETLAKGTFNSFDHLAAISPDK